jgi:hypothetical protein
MYWAELKRANANRDRISGPNKVQARYHRYMRYLDHHLPRPRYRTRTTDELDAMCLHRHDTNTLNITTKCNGNIRKYRYSHGRHVGAALQRAGRNRQPRGSNLARHTHTLNTLQLLRSSEQFLAS